jgi:hypothetical protein
MGPAARVVGAETLWQVYEQILYGDPEMPVWNRKPRPYVVVHPEAVDRTTRLKVIVLGRASGAGIRNQRVTLMAGWRGSADGPAFLVSGVTDEDGVAELDMAGWPEAEALVSLAVTPVHPGGAEGGYIPYRVMLPVFAYQQGWRRCTHCQALFHLNDRGSFCPRSGGGLHEAAAGEKYKVIANTDVLPPTFEQGWRWCRNCQALHQPGTGEQCHEPGGHNDTGSGHYALQVISAPDSSKPGWRRCDRCRELHLVRDGVTGPCHGGGEHTASGATYRVECA